jgi:hypothetical protein
LTVLLSLKILQVFSLCRRMSCRIPPQTTLACKPLYPAFVAFSRRKFAIMSGEGETPRRSSLPSSLIPHLYSHPQSPGVRMSQEADADSERREEARSEREVEHLQDPQRPFTLRPITPSFTPAQFDDNRSRVYSRYRTRSPEYSYQQENRVLTPALSTSISSTAGSHVLHRSPINTDPVYYSSRTRAPAYTSGYSYPPMPMVPVLRPTSWEDQTRQLPVPQPNRGNARRDTPVPTGLHQFAYDRGTNTDRQEGEGETERQTSRSDVAGRSGNELGTSPARTYSPLSPYAMHIRSVSLVLPSLYRHRPYGEHKGLYQTRHHTIAPESTQQHHHSPTGYHSSGSSSTRQETIVGRHNPNADPQIWPEDDQERYEAENSGAYDFPASYTSARASTSRLDPQELEDSQDIKPVPDKRSRSADSSIKVRVSHKKAYVACDFCRRESS